MAQVAQQPDDGDYVTKGDLRLLSSELRQEMSELEERLLAKLMPAITYTNRLNELVLDEIRPGWRAEIGGD